MECSKTDGFTGDCIIVCMIVYVRFFQDINHHTIEANVSQTHVSNMIHLAVQGLGVLPLIQPLNQLL